MSVFRELFVEVPLALLEAAVIKAQQPKETRAARLNAMCPGVWIQVFKSVDSVEWSLIDWQRAVDREEIHVRARLSCGHVGRFAVDEHALFRCGSTREIVNHLLDVVDKGPARSCKCGMPRGLGPAGKGMP